MYRTLGTFIFGIAAAAVLFFYGRDIWDAIRYGLHHHEGRRVGSDLVIALAQPFALVAAGNAINEDDVWDDSPDAVCEGAIAVENRSHHPLSVALDVRRRDGGALTLMDGPDSMSVAAGTSAVRVLRDRRLFGEVSDADCDRLNAPGALIVAIQACYGEGQGGDCSEAEIDPAGDAPGPRGQYNADRQDTAPNSGGHGNVGGGRVGDGGAPSY